MTYNVSYNVFPDMRGSYLYAAMLNIGIASANASHSRIRPLEALIDSGAARSMFHADYAAILGLKLESGRPEIIAGVTGSDTAWLHEVVLHLPGGPVKIVAGFMRNMPLAGLLGMNGFFEHFSVAFDSTEGVRVGADLPYLKTNFKIENLSQTS